MEKRMIPKSEIDEILTSSQSALNRFANSNVAIFGGTGFVGKWLVSTLSEANRERRLNMNIQVISSNPDRASEMFSKYLPTRVDILSHHDYFAKKMPADIVFHGATPTVNSESRISCSDMDPVNITVEIVSNAVLHKNFPQIIHLSSGAVYGKQDYLVPHQLESELFTDSPINEYTRTKIAIDSILDEAKNRGHLRYSSPRLYAFAGPHLPLDAHFAVGNFMLNAFNKESIQINGNPETIRTYLYPSDLIHSLLELCFIDLPRVVNIGSDIPITMFSLAQRISERINGVPIEVLGASLEPSRYVPSLENFRKYVSQKPFIEIDEIIDRWARWLGV